MTGVRRLVVTTVALLLAVATAAADASAATSGPRPGQCFMLTTAQLESMAWPSGAVPVLCTQPHTFEVTRTGAIPQDVNARYYAQQQCPDSTIWSDVGVNQPVGGIVERPVRVEGYWFVVGTDTFACGAAVRQFHGKRSASAAPVSSRIADLDDDDLAGLRFCAKATGGRDVASPPITVACDTVPRWEVARWVNWSDFYADFPGKATLRARAAQLCGPQARFSYPDRSRWAAGEPRTWCYTMIGG